MRRHLVSSNPPPKKKTGHVNFKNPFFYNFRLFHVKFCVNKQTKHEHILHKSVKNV